MGRIYWIVLANSIFHIIIIFSQIETPKFIIPSKVSPLKFHRPNYQKNAAPAKRVILFIMDYLNANTFYNDIVSAINQLGTYYYIYHFCHIFWKFSAKLSDFIYLSLSLQNRILQIPILYLNYLNIHSVMPNISHGHLKLIIVIVCSSCSKYILQ